MGTRGIGTAAVALALAAPTAAQGATFTVDPAKTTAGCDAANVCKTITDAANDTDLDGDDTVNVKPGDYSESPSFNDDDITVSGIETGQVRVLGGLTFSGDGSFQLQRVILLATSGSALTVLAAAAAPDKTVTIESSILSGSGSSPGSAAIVATSGASAGAITITARHVTIADSGLAHALSTTQGALAEPITTNFNDSIVKGTVPGGGVTMTNTDTTSTNDSLFVNPGAEDFHLKSTASAIDAGGNGASDGITFDVDGHSRPQGAAWDRGGDEIVPPPPPPGGGGDGSGVVPPPPPATTATGGATASTGPAVPDGFAPFVAITSPRRNQRLRARRRSTLRGRVSDETGVSRVEIALRRRVGRRCSWLDARGRFVRGSCSAPRFVRAIVDDFAWSLLLPRGLPPGAYQLRSRAVDLLGNRTIAFGAASRTLVAFSAR
jgi:hypothetical protein